MSPRDDLKQLLKKTVVTVNFKKSDDSLRKMVCTLNEEYLPEVREKETKKIKSENPDTLAVWDLEKQAWRSFKLDSIINYETNL